MIEVIVHRFAGLEMQLVDFEPQAAFDIYLVKRNPVGPRG